jgi:hypothetical protein
MNGATFVACSVSACVSWIKLNRLVLAKGDSEHMSRLEVQHRSCRLYTRPRMYLGILRIVQYSFYSTSIESEINQFFMQAMHLASN